MACADEISTGLDSATLHNIIKALGEVRPPQCVWVCVRARAAKCKPTAAYAAMRAACSKPLGQRELHDFLEDWRDNTFALYDGATDDGKPYSAALAAVRDITIETARSVNSVERDMGATRSAMESVDAKSKLVLPSGFLFKAVPYEGLQERTFTLRLGVNTGGDKLTLVLRMQRHSENASAVAEFLTEHPEVSTVLYPGLPSHPGHEIAARQMRRFGGMVSVRMRGGRGAARDLCAKTKVFILAESLGGVESLIEHPSAMTHASTAGSQLEVPEDLVRLSVGIEDIADLLADLDQALG